MRFGIGQPVTRKEDPRFLTGRGRYVADLPLRHLPSGRALARPISRGLSASAISPRTRHRQTEWPEDTEGSSSR